MTFNVGVGNMGRFGAGNVVSAGCGAVFGAFFGLLLIPASLYLVYHGELKLVNHGVVFARTAPVSPDAAAAAQGLTRFGGQPHGQFLKAARYAKPVVYWHSDVEEYQQDRDSDGDVTHEWNSVASEKHWASFKIGPVQVVGDKAKALGAKQVFHGYKTALSSEYRQDQVESDPHVGDRRLTVEVIDPGVALIVLGEVKDKACAGGSSFVISALDAAATEQALRTEYKVFYWVMKGGAVLLLWLGLIALLGPLMKIVGWIPFLGEAVGAALVLGALGFSVGVVVLLTMAVKYFWAVAAAVLLLVLVVIWRGFATPRTRPA